jgi:MoaA/NifB/PqqE/SkfB family radical SAM enzyme
MKMVHRDILEPISQRSFEEVPLETVMFDPTHLCPFNCQGCIERDAMQCSKNSSFSIARAKELLDQMAECRVEALGLYGGEPLHYRAFPEIIEYAAKLRFQKIWIVTNGFYLKEFSIREAIIEANTKTKVMLRESWNAATVTTHTQLHDPPYPCFNEIVQSTTDLNENGVQTGVSFLVERANHKEIFEAAKLAKEIGCAFFAIRPKTEVHGEHLLTLSYDIRSEILKQEEKSLSLEDENFKVSVPGWYVEYLNSGEPPKTEKAYSRCLVSLFRITITPPEPGVAALCAYRREVDKFISRLDRPLIEWMKTKRLEVFNRIDPRVDCAKVICNQDEMNRALYKLISGDVEAKALAA